MRRARLLVLAVLCFSLFAASGARAETAGQVLAVVGEALALRAGHIVRLFPGASVESGDHIHTGSDSGVQIRFTDWGFVSLRARTDFVVDDYVYEAGRGGRARAFFSLLNGGVRSLTGAIGHRDRSAFRLRTTTATVGVRGTHFSLLICKEDCRNPDGSLGEDGLYGEVLDGSIAVSPYGGASLEREFSAGQSFRLVNESSIPGPLFSPPPFLPDKLDPQARSGGAPVASVGGVIPGAGSPAPNPNPLPAVTGGLAGTLVSTLPVSALKPPLAKTTALVGGAVGNLGSTASGVLITPLTNQVVLPAAQLAGSMVNAALSMPALGPVVPLAGSALNAVPAVIAPILPALGSVVPGLPPVATPLPPVTVPGLPPVATLPPVTVPGLPPVTVPVLPPVTPPALPPVSTPVPPVTPPALPPVTVPTLPPVTVPTLPPAIPPALPPISTPVLPPVSTPILPPVTAPSLPPVSLPTVPSLPLSTKAIAPLLRR